MSTYDPRKDHHPIEPALQELGQLRLVGSRAISEWPPIATKDSDWDFYLVPKELEPPKDAGPWQSKASWSREKAIEQLEALGFKVLPDEGGPYGKDQLIEGIWRLDAHNAYGRNWPHVDVILVFPEVMRKREPVLQRIGGLGSRGGLLCRGLKAEKAWGYFWWVQQ